MAQRRVGVLAPMANWATEGHLINSIQPLLAVLLLSAVLLDWQLEDTAHVLF
jgi:hypothetical protein